MECLATSWASEDPRELDLPASPLLKLWVGPTILLYLGGQVSGGTHLLDTQAPSFLQPWSSRGRGGGFLVAAAGCPPALTLGATQQGVLNRPRADSGLKRNPLAAPVSPPPSIYRNWLIAAGLE